jgi:PilZ domain
VKKEVRKVGEEGQLERKSARVALEAKVQLRRTGKQNYRVTVHDVSLDGCRLEFVERPKLDEMVWVKFDGLDAIPSNVCWVRGFDVGVEFHRPIYPAVFDLLVHRLRHS